MPSDTFSTSSKFEPQLIPILQTHFDYYSAEDPVSVDSFSSSEESKASTVILLKSSVEVNVDDDPETYSRDQNKLASLSHLKTLPDSYDYLLFHKKEDVIKPKYGSKWDGGIVEQPKISSYSNKEGPLQLSDYFDYNNETNCDLNSIENQKETFTKSNNVLKVESEKSDTFLPASTNSTYAALSKGNFSTAMVFL